MHDHRLASQLRKGKQEAPIELVEAYYSDVYRYVYFKITHKEICEDITQETFLQFIRHYDQYVHKGSLKAYLFRIAHNLCVDYFKSKTLRMNEASSDGLDDYIQNDQNKTSLSQLQAYLQHLSKIEQDITIFRYYYGFTYKEIGNVVDMKISTVKYHTKLALRKLRKEMEEL